ncbi:hypothetical protein GW17_00001221 [Ensete ventricosum]|nr:hypothetical protein GW17_00001221 [Ensete ventricosum]
MVPSDRERASPSDLLNLFSSPAPAPAPTAASVLAAATSASCCSFHLPICKRLALTEVTSASCFATGAGCRLIATTVMGTRADRDGESDSGHGDGLYHDAMHALTVHQRRSRAEDSHPLVRACAMGDQRLCATRRRRLLPSTTDRGERGRRQ